MKQTVLFVLPQQFADYEAPYLATALQERIQDKTSPYEVKTLSLQKEPVRSIGGFSVLPDYPAHDYPRDYAALILVGGNTWRTEESKGYLPLVREAFSAGKIVGAICDATVFLGMNGFLNGKKHTSNTLENLMEAAGEHYTGKDDYQNEQAVRDGNLITANGTAGMEFAREVMLALKAYPENLIEENYHFFKMGFTEILKLRGQE